MASDTSVFNCFLFHLAADIHSYRLRTGGWSLSGWS